MTEMSSSPSRAEVAELAASLMRDIPDFPQPGVVFKDFTPLLLDPAALRAVVLEVAGRRRGAVDVVAGIEARGFIIGAALAYELGVGFVPLRKAGKLPGETVSASYALEYGTATIEAHRDAFSAGDGVLLVDDVLATGGTAAAGAQVVEACGGTVAGIEIVLEIGFLRGRERISRYDVQSLIVTD